MRFILTREQPDKCDRSFRFGPNTALMSGYGSSVGITTDYGLEGPVSNPGEEEILRSSRPALGPTQPPVKWVPGLSLGVKCGRGVLLTTHPSSSATVIEE